MERHGAASPTLAEKARGKYCNKAPKNPPAKKTTRIEETTYHNSNWSYAFTHLPSSLQKVVLVEQPKHTASKSDILNDSTFIDFCTSSSCQSCLKPKRNSVLAEFVHITAPHTGIWLRNCS